ncbi:putative zinc ion transporter [Scheffersomyces coipomensis]|uniref:putative zinc ion transporter n=1 Tax=Scheffersomyces coipomensis TaxID=1788519 RepID=UPI00315C82A0
MSIRPPPSQEFIHKLSQEKNNLEEFDVNPSFSFGGPLPSPPSNVSNPFISKSPEIPSSARVIRRESSWIHSLIISIPLILTYPIIILSCNIIFNSISDESNPTYIPIILSSILLSSLSLLLFKIFIHFNLVKLASISSSSSTSNLLANTVSNLIGINLIYASSIFLSSQRIPTLLLSLYVNQWSFYTPLSLMFDLFSSSDSTNTLTQFITILFGYVCIIVGFKLVKYNITHLNLIPLVVSAVISGLSLLILSISIDITMVGIYFIGLLVLLINIHDDSITSGFKLRFMPTFVSIITIIFETVVNLSSPPTIIISNINILLSIIITPDKSSLDLPKFPSSSSSSSSQTLISIIHKLLSHADTRAIFQFLVLNTAFMFVQLLYSFRSKSLGLLSDSLHMALDCISLAIGLIAGILSKNEIDINGKYPFGLKNFEILAGFTNATLLIGISGSIVFEAIGRLLNPVVLQKTNELIIVSTLGLIVNLVGIFAFNHGHGSHEGHSHGHSHSHAPSHDHSHAHDHSHQSHDEKHEDHHEGMNDNMKGIFLHILADTLGSVGVVISTLLTKYFGWNGFDPIASIIIASLIFVSAIPLIKSTASTLLLTLSTKKEHKVRSSLIEITKIKGVKSLTTPRFWPGANNSIDGYIHIQIYRGENGSYIKKYCEKIFENEDINAMIQIENDYDSCWCKK